MPEQLLVTVDEIPISRWLEYKELRLESLITDPQAFGASYQEAASRSDRYWQARLEAVIHSDQNWLLFAEKASSLIGMVGAAVRDSTADIISLYVREHSRGRGISKMLMMKLLSDFADSGAVKAARLTVNKDQISALTLYRTLGFETISVEETLLGDGQMHAEYLMMKQLRS